MSANIHDIVIVGGGIMGCSTAYNLMRLDDKLKVAVVEMDPTYTRASTTLSWANVRIHFSPDQDVSDVIARAVQLMLDHQVPMLGVRRGTSLETAFLEVTKSA